MGHRHCDWLVAVVLAAAMCCGACELRAQSSRCFSIELYYNSAEDEADVVRAALEEYAVQRAGLRLYFRDVHENVENRDRFDRIAAWAQLKNVRLPAVYGLKQLGCGLDSEQKLRSHLDQTLTLTAFVRNGCPHCRAAKSFLNRRMVDYPALKVVYREVVTDRSARDEMQKLTRRFRQQASSLPVLHFCNGVMIGFDRDSGTGRRILQTLDYWSGGCLGKKKREQQSANAGRMESEGFPPAADLSCVPGAVCTGGVHFHSATASSAARQRRCSCTAGPGPV